MQAKALLKEGRPVEALAELEQRVRAEPANSSLRVFLFQLLCVLGLWERALNQLEVAAGMDDANLLMAQVGREAIRCELLRAEIYAGKRAPLIFGEPAEWVAWLIQAISLPQEEASVLRTKALESAIAASGTIDDKAFEWLGDSDPRNGPTLEAIISGRYYWIPFYNIRSIELSAPSDLRDLVWTPVSFTWINGGDAVGFIPTRYSGSENSDEGAILMSRRTDWTGDGISGIGIGQRCFATDFGEAPILETRKIIFNT